MHLLLQILEEGKITDSLGQKIDFRNTIIIMTSNVGAELIKRQTALGFGAIAGHGSYEAMRNKILDESKRVFGDADALIQIDMSEYMEKFTASRLIGSSLGSSHISARRCFFCWQVPVRISPLPEVSRCSKCLASFGHVACG